MKNISLKTQILTGLLTGGLFLSSISTTFAATTKPLTTDANIAVKNECRQKGIKRQQAFDTNLKNLVADKSLTQDQANKIKAVIVKARAAKKANFEKTKTMTKEQRKAYMNSKKINHISPLKPLIENGTITQAQADKVDLGGHHGSRHKSGQKVK
ncbi:MAG TPA: hypothetical protein VIM70_15995 [Clostridium sp.]|uniref:hypothetical protein n=1 Tax=Clostridium sp. TaxID=1506 RepID=UPI002F958712